MEKNYSEVYYSRKYLTFNISESSTKTTFILLHIYFVNAFLYMVYGSITSKYDTCANIDAVLEKGYMNYKSELILFKILQFQTKIIIIIAMSMVLFPFLYIHLIKKYLRCKAKRK